MSIVGFYGLAPGFVGGDSFEMGVRLCLLCSECGNLVRRSPLPEPDPSTDGVPCDCPGITTPVNLTGVEPDPWKIRRAALDAGIPDRGLLICILYLATGQEPPS